MINWLVVFYGVAVRIMESQNWWFGDPKAPCKKHIQTLQNRRVQWFLRWTRENNKEHQHNTSELFWQFHGSQKKTHQLAPSREIHHVGKMTVSHSITPTQQDARFFGKCSSTNYSLMVFCHPTVKLDHLFPQVSGWVNIINNIWIATTRKITIHLHSLIHPPPRAPPQKKQGCLMISPAKRQFRQAFSGPRCRCMEVVTKRAASESNWVWGPKRMSTNPQVICNAQNHDVKHESSWSSWWLQPILQRWVNLDHFPM